MSHLSILVSCLISIFRTQASVRFENLALRHQIAVYQQSISRPKRRPSDRFFWVCLSRLWSGWQQALEFVQPQAVIAWQKKRFRDNWRQLSHIDKYGRPTISKEERAPAQHMVEAFPWDTAPRYLLRDRDSISGRVFRDRVQHSISKKSK